MRACSGHGQEQRLSHLATGDREAQIAAFRGAAQNLSLRCPRFQPASSEMTIDCKAYPTSLFN
jgi:hypothetical protein